MGHWTRRLVNTVSCRFVTMVQSGEPRRGDGRRLLGLIEVHLLAVGGGPTLDYADAAAFLAGFQDHDREGAQAAAAMMDGAAMWRMSNPQAPITEATWS